MLKTVIKAINEKKGDNIVAYDVSASSPLCDNIVICSANNEKQLVAIANSIDEELSKIGIEIGKIEGKGSKWLLVDVKSIIVHIFEKEERERYNLEKLWEPFQKINIDNYLID